MPHVLPRSVILLAAISTLALAGDPSPLEARHAKFALTEEANGRWESAAARWESALSAAELTGDVDRALEHGERALAAWRKVNTVSAREREARVLGVLSKLDIDQGRLVRGRARNLAALHLIESRIRETSGWRPAPGEPTPGSVSLDLLEEWSRAHIDTANWLDAQGRTVEAVELLNAVDLSVRGSDEPGRATRFYHRKVIGERALFLKFLGFQKDAIRDLELLQKTPPDHQRSRLSPQRLNLAYFKSQYYGPEPEYLHAVREEWEAMRARGENDRLARRLLAKMAYAYGEAGIDIGDLDKIVAEAKAAGDSLDAIYAQRDRAVLARQMGNLDGTEEALLQALTALRKRGVKRGEPTLYREYALVLLEKGRVAESIPLFKEAIRMTRQFGWTQHLPRLLVMLCSAQARINDAQGLEQTLRQINELIDSGKLIPERLFYAYCAKATVLLYLGRTEEAAVAKTHATEVADGAKLNAFQRAELKWTDEVQPITAPAKGAPRDGIVELAPAHILAVAPSDENARARFRISNATSSVAKGVLQVRGAAAQITQTESAVQVLLTEGTAAGEVAIELAAGDSLPIDVEVPPTSDPRALTIDWKEADQDGSRSIFQIRPSGKNTPEGELPAVTNTSLSFSNPFYSVPFHHPVYRSDGGNFRIKPSSRCRVEVLDAETQALLAVDAEGDGSYTGPGDLLALDEDQDGFPQLPRRSENGKPGIEILVFPLPGAAPSAQDLRIEVETKTQDQWQPMARDVLKAARKK